MKLLYHRKICSYKLPLKTVKPIPYLEPQRILIYNDEVNQLDPKLDVLEKKIDELQRSINKIRKIFLWMLILTLLFFLLPLAGLFFLIPKFLATYSNILQLQ